MKCWVIILIALVAIPIISAESTQQYNQIYLNPYFRSSLTNNINYSYNIIVDPPDGLKGIISAIVRFDVFLTPSVNFTLWVNNKSCNTPWYYVSTTYASSGQARVSFDCSNVINDAGYYTLIFRPSGANTGAINAWLDLTYMNDPKGTVLVSGTEYEIGDRATVFLQLSDDQGLPVNNAACSLDIYYPEMTNLSHPIYVHDGPMLYKTDSNGVYFYDLTVPNVTGVWMLSATCSYTLDGAFVYSLGGSETEYPVRTPLIGTYTGSSIFLNDYEDWIYNQCTSTGGATKYCDAYYDFNLSVHFTPDLLQNVTRLELYFMGEAGAKATLTQYWWNWSSSAWVLLPNILTYTGSATSVPIGIGDFLSNSVPIEAINNSTKIVRIRNVNAFGSVFTQFPNWLNMKVLTAQGTIHELKGSSEMHVTSHISALTALLNSIISTITDIWNKILGIEVTVNATYNSTQSIIGKVDNLTAFWQNSSNTINATIASVKAVEELTNQSVVELLGTEYQSGEIGKSFAQVTKGRDYVSGASCYLTVFYPNNTLFINETAMTYVGSHGLYQYNFTVPNTKGIYMATAMCEGGILGSSRVFSTNEWHVYVPSLDDKMMVIG